MSKSEHLLYLYIDIKVLTLKKIKPASVWVSTQTVNENLSEKWVRICPK